MTKYRIWLTWFLARLVAELMERTGRYLKSPLLHKYSMRRSILLAYLGHRSECVDSHCLNVLLFSTLARQFLGHDLKRPVRC